MNIKYAIVIFLLFPAVPGIFAQFPSMKQAKTPEFSFGLVADVQYADVDPSGTRYYRNSLGKFIDAIEHFNAKELAFVLSLGDFIDRYAESFDLVNAIADRLAVPLHHVLGNHDFPFPGSEKTKVLKNLQLEHGFYDFSYRSYRFIVLDGNDISLHANREDSEVNQKAVQILEKLRKQESPNAQAWNGGIGEAQKSWLEQTLQEAGRKGENVLLFCHFPVYPTSMYTLWNDHEMLEIIDAHENIVAWINGHDHSGDFANRNGVYYLTLHGMVETEQDNAYAVIDVFQDRLEVKGFGREPDRTLLLDPEPVKTGLR